MTEVEQDQLSRENERLRAHIANLELQLAHAGNRDGLDGQQEVLEEVERQREFLQQLINSATIGVAVVHGPSHIYELANPAYLDLVGARDKPLIGLPLADALPQSISAGEKWLLDAAYQNGKIVSVREYESQVDGRETYWDVDHIPLRDDGQVQRVLIIGREVTEDVRARRTIGLSSDMERSTQTLRTLIDILPAGVLVSDAAGHIIMENEASRRLTEGPATGDAYQPRGRYQLLYLNGEPFPVNELPMPRALQEGVVSGNIEILYRFEDGRNSIISASGSPVRDEKGELVGALSVMIDITERKAIEREREQRLAHQLALIEDSYQIIGEQTMAGLLQSAVSAARALTGANLAVFGHVHDGSQFEIGPTASDGEPVSCPIDAPFALHLAGVHTQILERKRAVRLTREEMESSPEWWGVPAGHAPLQGLLGAPLMDISGNPTGIMLLTDKQGDDFTTDDEALLVQLTTLTSLAMQHIEAREEVERRVREMEAVFAAATDVILVYDAAGTIIRANDAAELRYGVDPTGADRTDLLTQLRPRHPDRRLVAPPEMPAAVALQGTPVSDQTMIFTTADGHDAVASISAAPMLADGIVVGAVSVWRDITERYELQVQVEEERRLLAAVFSAAADLILVYDAEGRMIRANEAARRDYGFDPLRWDRQTLVDHFKPRHPDGATFAFPELPSSRALRGESIYDETIEIVLPSGQHAYISNSAAPMRAEDGTIVGAVAVWRNITERYELQIRLATERRLLEGTIQQIPGAIVIAEAPSGKVILVNDKLREYLMAEFEAEGIAQYGDYQGLHLDGRLLQSEEWPLARAIQHGETITNELITIVRKDASRLVLSVSASPVHDTEGNIVAGVASMYEVDPTTFTPRY